MNDGKRKIGEYTVLCSVNVGEKEIILASNEQSTNGDKFLCGFAERNDLFEPVSYTHLILLLNGLTEIFRCCLQW